MDIFPWETSSRNFQRILQIATKMQRLENLHLEKKVDGCIGKPINWFCALFLDLGFALPIFPFKTPKFTQHRSSNEYKHSGETPWKHL